MNNPFEQVRVTSLDCELRVLPESAVSHIWSVDLSDAEVEAGEQVYIEVVVESVLKDKKKYRCSLRIPEDLKPGKYALTVCGSGGYGQFLRKVVPHRFVARNLNELIEAERRLLGIGRDKLYVLLTLPAGGVTVESAELPDLPATKALILQSAKRALVSRPYRHWLEETVRTGTVITDKKVMTIVVEN